MACRRRVVDGLSQVGRHSWRGGGGWIRDRRVAERPLPFAVCRPARAVAVSDLAARRSQGAGRLKAF